MSEHTYKEHWEHYFAQERERVMPLLSARNITLDDEQVHTRGERYLMSGQKIVLTGIKEDSGERVIIKASSKSAGIKEIEHERLCRTTLHDLPFSGTTFLSPQELLYVHEKGLVVVINEFIEQPQPFLKQPLEEQLDLALCAFKMQESVHAATYAHTQVIKKVFGNWNAQDYITSSNTFVQHIMKRRSQDVDTTSLLERTLTTLEEHVVDIERYCGFLTHEDFALHNLRIRHNDIYLIDYSSLRFGNKHESWARFMNFMLHHNRPLEQTLVQYVLDNRSPEENHSLQLMRVYKALQLVEYYVRATVHAEGNIKKLSERRVRFWSDVLRAFLDGKSVPEDCILEYKKDRDTLRSEEEKERQRELQQL